MHPGEMVAHTMPRFMRQAMVDLAWACAVLKCRDISLLGGIADMGARLRAQHVSSSTHDTEHIAAASSRRRCTLAALACVHVDVPIQLTLQLHTRLAPQTLQCAYIPDLDLQRCAGETWIQDLRPQEAARLIWSYAALGYRPAGFIDRLAARAPVSRPSCHTSSAHILGMRSLPAAAHEYLQHL